MGWPLIVLSDLPVIQPQLVTSDLLVLVLGL